MKFAIPILFMCAISMTGLSHGDLDQRIEQITNQILENPSNDSLYSVRGTLYYQHQEYLKSIRDFEKVEDLIGSTIVTHMSLAKAWLALSKYDFALESVNKALAMDDENTVAYRLRAHISARQQDYKQAVLDYETVLQKSDKALIENYTDYLTALDSIGNQEAWKQAIKLIDRGTEALGLLPILQSKKVEFLLKCQLMDEAIVAQSEIISLANRKERHLMKRAELYIKNNETQKAIDDLISAQKAIARLSIRHANTKATKLLESQIDHLYQKLTQP